MSNATLDTQIAETEMQAMRRLLARARNEGVKLYQDHDGNYWAASASIPGRLYPLKERECVCRGFVAHGRCKHLAALWAHLEWIEPEPVTLPNCPECHGEGAIERHCSRWHGSVSKGYKREWSYAQPCAYCDGSGIRPVANIAA